MPMNPEIKAKWVAALRSGEYKQNQYFLNGKEGFCCLGVLCDLHAKETGGWWQNHSIANPTPRLYHGADSHLPIAVARWAGIDANSGGEVVINKRRDELTHHNDTGHTFAEIADAIESQL